MQKRREREKKEKREEKTYTVITCVDIIFNKEEKEIEEEEEEEKRGRGDRFVQDLCNNRDTQKEKGDEMVHKETKNTHSIPITQSPRQWGREEEGERVKREKKRRRQVALTVYGDEGRVSWTLSLSLSLSLSFSFSLSFFLFLINSLTRSHMPLLLAVV